MENYEGTSQNYPLPVYIVGTRLFSYHWSRVWEVPTLRHNTVVHSVDTTVNKNLPLLLDLTHHLFPL